MNSNRFGQQNKILIIGCDYPTFQIYHRVFAINPDYEVMGFIHVPIKPETGPIIGNGDDNESTADENQLSVDYLTNSNPPIHFFKAKTNKFAVFPLKNLEKTIIDKNVGKCFILCQNIPMKILQGIIHRIVSTGQCVIEFLQPKVANIAAFKPVISVTSLSRQIGKTQVCRHCCARLHQEGRKVAIIIPMVNLDPNLIRRGDESRLNLSPTVSNESILHIIGSATADSFFGHGLHPSHDSKPSLPKEVRRPPETETLNKSMDIALEVNEKSPHFELTSYEDTIQYKQWFSQDTLWQIENYFKVGAFRVYYTTDVNRAMIQAEQSADIIIYDSFQCEIPYIKTSNMICVASPESINQVAKFALWPGLVNFFNCNNVAIITKGQVRLSKEQKQYLTKLVLNQRMSNDKSVFYLNSIPLINDSSGMEIFNRKVLTISHEASSNDPKSVAVSMGASEVIDPPPFLEGTTQSQNISSIVAEIPHASSPTPETEKQTSRAMEKIAQIVNKSDAEVIIASIPTDIPGIDPYKKVLYTSPEIDDTENNLEKWLSKFYLTALTPPLHAHFTAQVDILMALADTTDKELFVTNNQSANREALCQLFLTSHLPPGFRAAHGEVIDSQGNHTGQIDVVIVNETAPYFTIDSSNSVITPILADYVLAVVEVKSTLTSESLKKALSQLRPVKSLMPMHETLKMPNGDIIPDPLGGKIITGVFSFTPANEIDSKIYDILKLYPNVVDFIVLPDSFAYFHAETLRVSGFNLPGHIVNGYVKFSSRGMGLAIVFGILNSIAGKRRFNGSNCVNYLSGFWGDEKQQDFEIEKPANQQSMQNYEYGNSDN